MGAQCRDDGLLHPGNFQFNVEEYSGGVTGQYVFQRWRRFCEVGRWRSCDGAAEEFGIVADQEAAVAGAAHVELETITGFFQGQVKSAKRVFGDAGNARTTMSE